MSVEIHSKKIEKAKKAVLEAERKYQEAKKQVQKACKHPIDSVIEGEYASGSYYSSASPPFRVCKLCGYAEEGWHCGYWKLGSGVYSGVPSLPRNEAFKYVRGRIHPQSITTEVRFGRMPESKLWES